jgi:hypothetical protein
MPVILNSAPLGAIILFPLVVQPAMAVPAAEHTSRQVIIKCRRP